MGCSLSFNSNKGLSKKFSEESQIFTNQSEIFKFLKTNYPDFTNDKITQLFKVYQSVYLANTNESLSLLNSVDMQKLLESCKVLHLSISTKIFLDINEPKILLARPLDELASHFKHKKIPKLQLIARVIKTIVCSVFRWHLYDRCALSVNGNTYHSFNGELESDSKKFEKENYFLLANAHALQLKNDIVIEKKEFEGTEITPDTICQHFGTISNKDITGKQMGNTIWNLFRSNLLELQIPSDKEREEIINSYKVKE